MHRQDVRFTSHELQCAGWWYTAPGASRQPFIVMAHGLGATRELGLDAFARRFCEAGLSVLLFDYRHYGQSQGQPRELLSIRRQHADYRAALAFARAQPDVDPLRAVLWGTSFSGGHVLALAAQDLQLSAVIAQTPFVSAASLRQGGAMLRKLLIGTGLAAYDLVASALGGSPVYLPLLGPDDTVAALVGTEHERGYRALVPPEVLHTQRWRNRVAARFVLDAAVYEPARSLASVHVPSLFVVAEEDTVCPSALTRRSALHCPTAEVVSVPGGHFDCYTGAIFERAIHAQLAFLHKHGLAPKLDNPSSKASMDDPEAHMS